MCGIVGYAGPEQAAPVLLDGLRRLEYRGYDSAGAVVCNGRGLQVRKAQGRLARLLELVDAQPLVGTAGLGHTRWATHGRPSDVNAHPHLDCAGRIAVVHNGIIENYLSLRERLRRSGHRFVSETDTEVLPHLIEEHYDGDLLATVRRALAEVRGSWAIGAVSAEEPGRLVVARQDSPLVIGLGAEANYIASDIPALLPYTRQVYVLEDGEVASVTGHGVRVLDRDGRPLAKQAVQVNWDVQAAEKGGYEHFMLKEIYEQPRAVRDTLAGRIDRERGEVRLDGVRLTAGQIRDLERVYVIGMGTARHAGLVGKPVIERLARIPVEVDLGSEFRYRDPLVTANTLTVVISQSGETADTLAALREARARGSKIVAITNVVGSSVAREADDVLYTWAGPEVAVASTKAYLTQLVGLYLLAAHLGRARDTLDMGLAGKLLQGLGELPAQIEAVLQGDGTVADRARELSSAEHIFFIGRGLDYAVAMEGALKLKEISYIHAEAYAAGELKHGTLALVTDGVPVVALATQEHLLDKMLSNVKEVKARGATVLAVAREGAGDIAGSADRVLTLPATLDLLAPVLAVVPLQLFAYHAARLRGCDVDKPRNLAKSVTVE